MRIKLDENLPARLVDVLSRLGHSVETVVAEGLRGEADTRVWQAAQSESRLLVTQDLDFSDIHRYAPGTHSGIVLIRLRDPGREALLQRVSEVFQLLGPESLEGAFVVVTESKIRLHPPGGE